MLARELMMLAYKYFVAAYRLVEEVGSTAPVGHLAALGKPVPGVRTGDGGEEQGQLTVCRLKSHNWNNLHFTSPATLDRS